MVKNCINTLVLTKWNWLREHNEDVHEREGPVDSITPLADGVQLNDAEKHLEENEKCE